MGGYSFSLRPMSGFLIAGIAQYHSISIHGVQVSFLSFVSGHLWCLKRQACYESIIANSQFATSSYSKFNYLSTKLGTNEASLFRGNSATIFYGLIYNHRTTCKWDRATVLLLPRQHKQSLTKTHIHL